VEFKLITPNSMVYQTEADLVGGRTSEGSFSILPRHIPAIMELEPALLKVKSGEDEEKFIVQGGFLFKERDETIKILTPEAKNIEDIDLEDAESRVEELTNKLEGMESDAPDFDYTQTELRRAEKEVSVVQNE